MEIKYLLESTLKNDLEYVKKKITPCLQTYKYFNSPKKVTSLKFQVPLLNKRPDSINPK